MSWGVYVCLGECRFVLGSVCKSWGPCRCLSCDTDLQLQRNMQQGRPPSKPSLLPKLIGPGVTFTSLHSSSDPGTGWHLACSLALWS